jgi:uncharacterized membrane protein
MQEVMQFSTQQVEQLQLQEIAKFIHLQGQELLLFLAACANNHSSHRSYVAGGGGGGTVGHGGGGGAGFRE